MEKQSLITSINLKSEEVLTLEKAEDRMEFQALMFLGGEEMSDKGTCAENWDVCPKYVACPSDAPTVPDPTPC